MAFSRSSRVSTLVRHSVATLLHSAGRSVICGSPPRRPPLAYGDAVSDPDKKHVSKDSLKGFRGFSIIVGVGIGAWNLYLVVAWLLSDWPLVALYPAMFVVVGGGGAYGMWKHGWASLGFTTSYWVVLWLTAVIAVLGAVSLYYASDATGDDVYAETARAMAIWGSLPVFFALLSLLLLIPGVRRRMDSNRAAAEKARETDQH